MKNREKLHGTRLNISEIICGCAAMLKKMKKNAFVAIMFFAIIVGFTVEAHAAEISDYGRQVTEAFLSEFTSLFSFGQRNADGTYLTARFPQIELTQNPHFIYDRTPSVTARFQDRAGNYIPSESLFRRFGLFAMDFRLFDFNNDGIPEIFIYWTHSTGSAEWGAERWTLYLYDGNGGFRDSGRLFETTLLDFFFDTNGEVLMAQIPWGCDRRVATYSYVYFDGEDFVTLTSRSFRSYAEITTAFSHHRSNEFRENPTRVDTGTPLIPIQLTDVQNEIRESILAWLYAPYYAPSPLFQEPDAGIRVRVDRQFIDIPAYEPQPFISESQAFVPFFAIATALGLTEDTIPYLEPYAQNVGGRMAVPVRAIAELANMDVQWDGVNRIVNITTPRVQLQDESLPLGEIRLNTVDVEVLHFIRGIYRITVTPEHYTIDPSLTPFFFWSSEYGTFSDIVNESNGILELTFYADVGTSNRNVTVIIGIEDGFGRFNSRSIVLKGNDWHY